MGVNHQPVTTQILEKLGFIAYYYTGDMGSAPNRTFVNGKMVSDKVIAFPDMPNGTVASFAEMKRAGISAEGAKKWMDDILDYAVKNRTVRLFYSHLYDISEFSPDYFPAVKALLDDVEQNQDDGKLELKSMSYFAKFLLRFLKTEYTFKNQGDKLEVNLKNSEGLSQITMAIPKVRYQKPGPSAELFLDEDETYYYLTYNGNSHDQTLSFAGR